MKVYILTQEWGHGSISIYLVSLGLPSTTQVQTSVRDCPYWADIVVAYGNWLQHKDIYQDICETSDGGVWYMQQWKGDTGEYIET